MLRSLVAAAAFSRISSRGVTVLRRKYPLRQPKEGEPHKNLKNKRMLVYEVVEITEDTKRPPLTVVLKENVEGFGNAGDVLSLEAHQARYDFILPGIADYATPEALEWSRQVQERAAELNIKRFSSKFAAATIRLLREHLYSLEMSESKPWQLDLWHIRAALRKDGLVAPDIAILLPEEPIQSSREVFNKDIIVSLLINGVDRAACRFRIRSAQDVLDPVKVLDEKDIPWFLEEPVALLESQKDEIAEMHRATVAAYKKVMDERRDKGLLL